MKIGRNITDRQTAGLSNPRDAEDFEKFIRERKNKKAQEEEEQKLSTQMPNEGEPTDNQLANQREELYKEKRAHKEEQVLQIDEDQ